MNKMPLRFITLFLACFCITELTYAQPAQVSPISTIKSTDSDDPFRYFHPADIGIPAGDINGDGLQEYINHTGFSADLSTEELGDYIDKSLVCNYSDEGERLNCSIYDGGFLYPAGDLNNDGRDDLLLEEDGILDFYSFGTGDLDVSTLPTSFTNYDFGKTVTQVVPGFDFDGDDKDDLVFAANDFSDDDEMCVMFTEPVEFNCSTDQAYFISVGSNDIKINAGDVTGDDRDEIVALHTSPFPYELFVSIFSVDNQRAISHESTTSLGSGTTSANTYRFYIVDADGENKDDLIFSEDRYSTGGGFTQIFFNEPNAFIAQSLPGETPFTQPRILVPGHTVNQVSQNIAGDVGITFTNKTSLSLCSEDDIVDPLIEPTGNACTNIREVNDLLSEGDQIFENRSCSCNFEGVNGPTENLTFFSGVLQRDGFSAGTAVTNVLQSTLTTFLFVQTLVTIYSEIIKALAINPNQTLTQFGTALIAIPFTQGFFSINSEVGLNLDFIGSEETTNISGRESNNVFPANGEMVSTSIFGVADIFGNEGFTFWFKKELASAEGDTSTLEQTINLHDFQQFDDTLVFPGANNIGDINNDGFDELLFSSRTARLDNNLINKIWIFYGAETYNSTPDLTWDFNQDSTIGTFDFPNIGAAIEGLGDVNGDGIDDFALGLTGHMTTGVVYVYFGEDNPEKSSSFMVFDYPDIILEPRVLEGQTVSSFGSQISAGDFDGNGTVDIAVGSDFSFGTPAVPTIQIFNGGVNLDGEADVFLSATKASLGRSGDEILSGTSLSTIQFLPAEEEDTHQDILFSAGNVFFGYTDAIIFEGGAQADSIPDIQLINPNDNTGFGLFNRSKPGIGDMNDDGFYDIILVNQLSNEDGFVSSRAYIFSPNAGITISNEGEKLDNPLGYRLSQNYPNPFNPSTNIEFRLPKASNVSISVYDVLGREVASIVNNVRFSSGSNTVAFNASNLASGMYIYRLKAGAFTQTRKMMLIK